MTSMSLLDHAVRGEAFPEPLTTEQYHRMIETGVLMEGTPIELIDGILVRKDRRDSAEDSITTVGPGHCSALTQLMTLLISATGGVNCHVRCQQPIHVPPRHEPEPDHAVVRGGVCDYNEGHPEPEHVLLLVEVSDSSLSYDRGEKLRVYAAAEISQYWIVNLSDRCIEVYTQPSASAEPASYQSKQVFERGQSVSFDVDGQTLELDVNAVLPA
jgi:Uma2 family endonuclease